MRKTLINKNKKAQVGETMTWIVATLVIIGTLLVFIYGSIFLANSKSLGSDGINNKIKQQIVGTDVDWIDYKNKMAFEIRDDNRIKIENWLNETRQNP